MTNVLLNPEVLNPEIQKRFVELEAELGKFTPGTKVKFNELDLDLSKFEPGVVVGLICPQLPPDQDDGFLSVNFGVPDSHEVENLWLTADEALTFLTLCT